MASDRAPRDSLTLQEDDRETGPCPVLAAPTGDLNREYFGVTHSRPAHANGVLAHRFRKVDVVASRVEGSPLPAGAGKTREARGHSHLARLAPPAPEGLRTGVGAAGPDAKPDDAASFVGG